jgi:penicillin-binding protein 1B
LPVRIRIPGRPLARRKNKGARKPHPLVFQIAVACIAAIIVAGAVWVWIQYRQYAKIADETLARGPIPDTSMLYAAPEVVGPGDPGTPIDVADELQESGYAQDDRNAGLGWFHLEPHAIAIYPGASSDTQGEVPATIQFNAGKIVSITSLKDQQPLDTYALEPHVLSSLWDKKREKRRVVRYEEIPPVLVHAVISAEDKHFFTNSGFDLVRIAKVAWHDLLVRKRSHWVGASTLTQQLARMLWLSNRKTFSRKVAEALITIHLERKLTKQEIFQYYANDVPLGRRGSFAIRGFGEAAQAYFGKSIRQLNLPEAATLAGLVQEPSYRNPVNWPKRAQNRRNVVLKMMLENHYITQAQYQTACAAPMKIVQDSEESADAPYFVDMVNTRLGDEFPDADFQTDGARIYTTIDPNLQRDAVQAVADGMKKVNEIFKARHDRLVKLHRAKPGSPYEKAQVALIALDPHTGEIKALDGGTNYGASQFNHALAERPSGSAIKPIVYAAALNTAFTSPTPITASTIIADEPTTFTYDGKAYQPMDFERGQWQGNVTVRKAFAESLNVPAVEVAQAAGYDNVANLAHEAGLENIKPTPAEALGAYNVTPLSIARAYTIFANDGEEVEPRFISRIVDKNGTQMWASQAETKDILDPRVNYLVVSLMQQVMRSGTGVGARAMGFTLPAAGKTGTSPQDAWFAGFTSKLLCVVWVGLDSYHEIHMEGAEAALPIWAEFMKLAHQRAAYSDATDFPMPPGIVSVEIDPLSGDLAGPACPAPRPEYYILGTQPPMYCPLHRSGATEIAGWENSPAAPSIMPPSPAAAAPMVPALAEPPPEPGNTPEKQQKKDQKKKKGFFDKLKSIFR